MPVSLTWLGHAAFRFDTPSGKRVYVDPYLENPKCPESEREPERCDLVLITHGHDDHVGSTLDLHKRFRCEVLAPVELADWLVWLKKALPGEKVHDPNKGGTVDFDGFSVTLTDANHSSSTADGDTMVYLGEPTGQVVTVDGGPTLYFAGDTNVFGDMQLIRRIYAPDVAVLPIGGHYTMGPGEAAVALELLGVRRCVPCHYGTFPILAGTPDELRRLAPDVEVLEDVADVERLRAAHEAGTPVVVRARTADEVRAALARPEVACALVPQSATELLELDLPTLTYG